MAYLFKSGESIPEGVKRIATEELVSAASLLGRARASDRDEAIHEARKSIKKTRALLRLVRDELGESYTIENRRLRDTARKLSDYRDAHAMIEVFDALKRKYQGEWKGRTLASIRRELVMRKRERERRAGLGGLVKRLASNLESAAGRVKDWPLSKDGFAAIEPGLSRGYRRARRAMAVAGRQSKPEDCHAWRRRLKDHWYQVRLLEGLWTDVMQGYENSLKNLQTWLGDHHNLEVLRIKLTAQPRRFGDPRDVGFCLDAIGKFQKELRRNALSLGERVYDQRTRQYRQAMQDLWRSWQSQPKSLKEIEKRKHDSAGA